MKTKVMRVVFSWSNKFYLAIIFVFGAVIAMTLGNVLAERVLLTLMSLMVLIGGLLLFYTIRLMFEKEDKGDKNEN